MKKLLFLLLLFLHSLSLFAQIDIETPLVGNAAIASAPDYATQVLGNPWDMDGRNDLAEYIQHADYGEGLSHHTDYYFNNQRFNYKILSNSSNLAFFHLLSPGQPGTNPLGKNGQVFPIKSASYRYLIFRAWASRAGNFRVLWNIEGDYIHYARTIPMTLYSGWRTYVIDLATVFTASGPVAINPSWLANTNITGLRLDTYKKSASDPNIDVSIDWVRLVGPATSSFAVDYNFTAQGTDTQFSIFLDDDTNPFNGFVERILMAGATGTSTTFVPTYVAPGSYKVLGITSDDFAMLHGIPWKMTALSDVDTYTSSVVNPSIVAGKFSASVNATNAYLELNMGGNTIDASKFRYLTIALDSNSAGNTYVRWYNSSGAQLGVGQQFSAAGTQQIDFDMQGLGGWSGQVAKIRIYPKANVSNFTFALDYVTLRQNSYTAVELTLPSADVSPGNLIINSPPTVQVLQPDPRGGIDFAATKLGKAWSMSALSDINSVHNLSEAWIYPNNYLNGRQGDFFCAQNKSNNSDPYQDSFWRNKRESNEDKIDATRFKNATVEFYIAREQDVVNGSVMRMISWNMARDTSERNGDDVMIPHVGPNWLTLTQDMTKIKLEQIIHPPGSYPTPIWDGFMELFRVDIHEFTDPTWYCIDSIELRADDEANSSFALTYNAQDIDSDASNVNVAWYYGTAESVNSGTHIATVNMASNSRVYVWNTSAIPNGTYWVHARISDGLSQTRKMGHRLVINHGLQNDETLPIIEYTPSLANTTWRQKLRLKGYALDNIQLALVEVLIDDQLVHTFVPNLFNKTARDLFPEYADASRAGFDERISITNQALGAHTIKVRTFDTTGNMTEDQFSFTRVAGGDPSFAADPQVDEARIAVPLNGKSTQAKLSGNYKPKKKQLTITMENLHGCNELKLVGHYSEETLLSDPTQATLLRTLARPNQKASLKAKKVKGFARLPEFGNGLLYIGAICDGKMIATRRFSFGKGKPAVKNYADFLTMLIGRIQSAVL